MGIEWREFYISALLATGFLQVPSSHPSFDEFLPCPHGTFSNSTSKGKQGCIECPPGAGFLPSKIFPDVFELKRPTPIIPRSYSLISLSSAEAPLVGEGEKSRGRETKIRKWKIGRTRGTTGRAKPRRPPFPASPACFCFDSLQALRTYFSSLPIFQPERNTKEASAEERALI